MHETVIKELRLTENEMNSYLKRIRYAGPLHPDHTTLDALHRAHRTSVPFETLDIHLGRTLSLRPSHLFQKLVTEKRGGFCYEHNLLFAAVLQTLGLSLHFLSARVRGQDRVPAPPFDHMALLVDLPDEPLLTDVGFGECFEIPIPLSGNWIPQSPGKTYRVKIPKDKEPEYTVEHIDQEGGDPTLDYVFDLKRHAPHEFEEMCKFHQTSPRSPFTQGWICTLPTPEGRITLRGKPKRGATFVETKKGHRQEISITSSRELETLLQQRFDMPGISIPRSWIPESAPD